MGTRGHRSPGSETSSGTLDSLDRSFLSEMEAAARVQQNTWTSRLEAQLAINVRFYILYNCGNFEGRASLFHCRQYTPDTRLIEFRQDDILCRRGYPHEVTLPLAHPHSTPSWVTYPYFLEVIAANWTRRLMNNERQPVVVRFTDVLKYRMLKQSRRSEGLFNVLEQLQAHVSSVNHIRRVIGIFEGVHMCMGFNMLENFRELIDSTIVTNPFDDFTDHYLRFNPDTPVPMWDKVQAHLGKQDPTRQYRTYNSEQRAHGLGAANWRAPVSRRNWTVERSACRFVLWMYHLMTHPETDEERKIAYKWLWVSGNWIDCSYVPPLVDRHWFGYAILCLLIWSWQYKQEHRGSLSPEFEQMLLPVLDERFCPLPFAFRRFPVGQLDISPTSPWIFQLPREGDRHLPTALREYNQIERDYLDGISLGSSGFERHDVIVPATPPRSARSASEVPLDLIERWAGVSQSDTSDSHIIETEDGGSPVPAAEHEPVPPSMSLAEMARLILLITRPPATTEATQPAQPEEPDTDDPRLDDNSDTNPPA